MTREEILQIEALTNEELAEIAIEAKMVSWDLKLSFVGLFQTYTKASDNSGSSAYQEFLALCDDISALIAYLDDENSISKIFEEKWQKLEPFLSKKNLEMRPTKKILESWAKALAYIFDSEPIFWKLARTTARIQIETQSPQVAQLVFRCRKFSEKLRKSRLQVFKMARRLGDHDGSRGKETLAELKSLGEEQLQLFRQIRMNE